MRWLLATLLLAGAIGCRTADQALDLDVYGTVQSFRWTETASTGERLLKETGPLFGAGIEWNPPWARVRGELFGGRVDYDGQTQAGVPVQTNTNYFGVTLEGDYRFIKRRDRRVQVSPFIGLGLTSWVRDIQSTTIASGVTETWTSFYGHVGVDYEQKLGPEWRVFGLARFGYSFYNRNEADIGLAGLETVTVEPGPGPRVRGELGFAWTRLRVAFFGEYVVFEESDAVVFPAAQIGFLQPESKLTVFGLRAGWRF